VVQPVYGYEVIMESHDGSTPVHLVLSAGGVKVLSYAGALSVLAERGISFASVSGCSAGTFVGAMLCAGKTPQEIEQLLSEVKMSAYLGTRTFPRPFRLLSFTRWPFAVYREPGIPDFLSELVRDDLRFKDLIIPFSTFGVDLASDRILVYSSETHPDMLVSEALRIATAQPLAYPPHEKQGRVVVDGALASHSPVWLATAHNDTLPILVLRPAKTTDVYYPKSVFRFIEDLFESSVGSRDDYITKQIPRVRVLEIDCGSIRSGKFDLPRKEREFLIIQGRTAAEDVLSQLGEDLNNVTLVSPEAFEGDGEDDVAERYGERIMKRFHQRLSNLVRENVFISYSHKDKDWLEKLQTHLRPYTRNASIMVWDDGQIKGGARWREEIRNALASAKVAILLVSPDFLASDFIADYELPPLLEAAETEGLTILWVPLSHSAYRETRIGEYQAAAGCDPDHPISGLPEHEQDRAFVAICEEIKELVNA
jgi:predicted acylesterase/phospholipase RssA